MGFTRSSLCTVAQYALTFSAYAGANGATEATINTILKLDPSKNLVIFADF